MHYSDRNWQRFGKENPYYGVLTSEKFRRENLTDQNLNEFFQSGESLISQMVDETREYLNPDFHPEQCLDFGCGVGRLTIPLAKRFERVSGVDVSEAMLAETALNAKKLGLSNIDLIRSDDQLSRVSGPFDFILSYIVLQHIPVRRGLKLFSRLVDLLGANGVAALHLTYHDASPGWRKYLGPLRQALPLVHNLANLMEGRRFGDPHMQMYCYDLNLLLSILQEKNCSPAHIRFTNHGGFYGALLFFEKQQKVQSQG